MDFRFYTQIKPNLIKKLLDYIIFLSANLYFVGFATMSSKSKVILTSSLKRPLQQPHVPSENSHPVFKTREKVRSNIRGRGIRNVPQKRYSEQFFSAFYMCFQVKQSNRQTESEWDMIWIIYLQPNCVTKIFLKSHFNSYYRESSPYVNFISANFISAILQKNSSLCKFWAILFHQCDFLGKNSQKNCTNEKLHKANIRLMRILANANFFQKQKLRQARTLCTCPFGVKAMGLG